MKSDLQGMNHSQDLRVRLFLRFSSRLTAVEGCYVHTHPRDLQRLSFPLWCERIKDYRAPSFFFLLLEFIDFVAVANIPKTPITSSYDG
jgi:hypothetical protein